MISLSQWFPNFFSLQIANYLKNDVGIGPASLIVHHSHAMNKPRNVTIYCDFTQRTTTASTFQAATVYVGETGGQWQEFTVMLHGCISKDIANL